MTRIFTHDFETRTTHEFWSIGTGIRGSITSAGRIISASTGTLHYPLAAERPPNTTNFVESSQAGLRDLYELTDYLSSKNGVIKRILVEAYARELTADGDKIRLGLGVGNDEYWGNGQTLGIDWASYQETWLTNPANSSSWEKENIPNLKVGVKTE